MDSSPELRTLLNHHEQLSVIIRNNIDDIALCLHREGVINRDKYREVTDSKYYITDTEKAKRLLRWLEDKVEEDTNNYSIFCGYLRSKKQYSKILAQMREVEAQLNTRGKYDRKRTCFIEITIVYYY